MEYNIAYTYKQHPPKTPHKQIHTHQTWKTHIHRCIQRYFKSRYTEHIKALTQPLITSNFAERIYYTHLTYTNIETYLEILQIIPNQHTKWWLTRLLASHTNISAIPTTMKHKTRIAASSTGTGKYWKWTASAKNVKSEDFAQWSVLYVNVFVLIFIKYLFYVKLDVYKKQYTISFEFCLM